MSSKQGLEPVANTGLPTAACATCRRRLRAVRPDDAGSGSTPPANDRSEAAMMGRMQSTGRYRDSRIDTKIVLSALWAAMLIVFAYGDILGLLRADVLRAALDGRVAATGLVVDQLFLGASAAYVLVPVLMVILALTLPARLNRAANIVVAVLYGMSIVASCVGESWIYFLLGSAVEVVLLSAIAVKAWTWPIAALQGGRR